MALTPYQLQSNVLAVNCEVADRQALIFAEACNKDYAQSKKEYQLSRDRFSTRVPRPAAPDPSTIVTAETMREDIRYYTSCPDPNTTPYYNEDGTATTRALDKELKERARMRQRDDLAHSAKSAERAALTGTRAAGGNGVPALLGRLEEMEDAERQDLLQIEASHFRVLAKKYYDVFYGKFDSVLTTEREGRRALEDIATAVELSTLAQLRDKIHHSEELLVMRAMGFYPMQLLRNSRAKQIQDAEEACRLEEASRVLDSMYAAPLWQRVQAIRAETEAEQESIFHVIELASCTEADFVERRFGRNNMEKGGIFEIPYPSAVPGYFDESIRYIYSAERLFCELGEEAGRMALIDEALQCCEEIYSAANQIPENVPDHM